MQNPLDGQANGMFLYRRWTWGNFRRAGVPGVYWAVPRDSDYFWLGHDYYARMNVVKMMQEPKSS